MMDHREFVAGLDPEVKAALTERSDAVGLRHLSAHGGGIALCGLWIAMGWPLWWLLLPVQGVLIVFLFTLEHEATHKTPFASAALNEWVGRIAGFLLVLPFTWFRYFHLAHHRWTNIPGRDPELAGDKPDTVRDWVWHVSGIHYWMAQGRLIWDVLRGGGDADYLPAGAMARIRHEVGWMVAGYAAILILWPGVVWVWVIPVLLCQPVLRLYLLAEHGDCPQVANMFENTRTVLTDRVVRFLAWNMPYHTEHHVYPAVPFHRLPALHRLMQDELRVTAAGYAAFTRDYLARRRPG